MSTSKTVGAEKVDTSILQKIIIGRVEPHIYSFTTNTLPNYLKVGDTYRPVEERLNEWRRHYKDLQEVYRQKSSINDEVFFRDYAVHKYLNAQGFLQVPINHSANIHSDEFFKDASKSDVSNAVDDVVKNYKKTNTYDYYTNLKEIAGFHYERIQDFKPRANQKKVIDAFEKAVERGRRNLLMYAVMRFGKSVTTMWAAKSINSKLTVVVSGKADVYSEWKQTVESHKDFTGYRFLDKKDLKKGLKWSNIYGKKFKTALGEEVCTNIVLFLTLHDLSGSSETIKNHHKILQKSKIDLLVIDETHFGARAAVLGKILSGVEITDSERESLKPQEDQDDMGPLNKLQSLKAEVKLHLSGTPYRILMGGEFGKEDVIAFVQFSDIYEAKLDWTRENLDQDEWKNPYYGFPQMIRFAFNPNESSRERLKEIQGGRVSELFAPASAQNRSGPHTFLYEPEVVDLLRVLDGSKSDSHMLSLLNNEKVKEGKLARHIVMVLPLRASCDALESLLKKEKSAFKNLSTYTILNISGLNKQFKNPEEVKAAIQKAEKAGKKTITLTVNKMLTGSTVPQWDTMIYLKGTTSPQEYDQAIFRLQSPWVETYKDTSGQVIKYDMKPQTLLVDLDPTRLFHLQELKAFTYGVNVDKKGNEEIEASISRELAISPIITLNAEGNRLVEVTPTNIIDQARNYASDRTITEDVQEIGIDGSLKNDPGILEVISKLPELGAKSGLSIKPNQEEGDDFDGLSPTGKEVQDQSTTTVSATDTDESISKFEKQFRTYYVMIILFAFLSETEEKTLRDVIKNIDVNADNRRIAHHLGLQKKHLELIREKMNPYVRSTLEYKIQNADFRSYDNSITPVEHIEIAINKFGRLSEAEVFTPIDIVLKIYNAFDKEFWGSVKNAKVLDIASKSGIFAKGFVDEVKKRDIKVTDIKNNFYSIPTSGAAYEFTRKMYTALGLNVDNIAKGFNSFDLIKLSQEQVQFLLLQNKKFCDISLKDLEGYTDTETPKENMKFTAIVGNPPYQENTGTNFAAPIYHLFFEAAKSLGPEYVSLIHPARFLFNAGATPKEWNKKMLNDPHLSVLRYEPNSQMIFPGVDIMGGICITFWNKNITVGGLGGLFIGHKELQNVLARTKIGGFEKIILPQSKTIKPIDKQFPTELRIRPNYFEKFPNIFTTKKKGSHTVKIIGLEKGNKRAERYVKSDFINDPNIKNWKVFVPKSNGSGAIGEVVSTPIIGIPLVGKPGVGCTGSFIQIGSFLEQAEANHCLKYTKTKFCRALLGTLKVTQDNPKDTWRNVPLQDFTAKSDINWSKSIAEIDNQLYKKYGLDKTEIDFIEKNVKPMS